MRAQRMRSIFTTQLLVGVCVNIYVGSKEKRYLSIDFTRQHFLLVLIVFRCGFKVVETHLVEFDAG